MAVTYSTERWASAKEISLPPLPVSASETASRKPSGSADNVYGFFFVGENAGEYTDLPGDDAIINKVMSQLDLFYDGKASRYYVKHNIQNWSKAPYTLGAYSDTNTEPPLKLHYRANTIGSMASYLS